MVAFSSLAVATFGQPDHHGKVGVTQLIGMIKQEIDGPI
jgi:hypothetical protein